MSISASAGRDVRALARRLLPRPLLGLLPTARRLAGIRGYPG